MSTVMSAKTQTEEFDFLLDARPSGYKAPDKVGFDLDEKFRFYTELPSGEIVMWCLGMLSRILLATCNP